MIHHPRIPVLSYFVNIPLKKLAFLRQSFRANHPWTLFPRKHLPREPSCARLLTSSPRMTLAGGRVEVLLKVFKYSIYRVITHNYSIFKVTFESPLFCPFFQHQTVAIASDPHPGSLLPAFIGAPLHLGKGPVQQTFSIASWR